MKFRSGAPCKTGRRSEVTTVKIAVIGAGASGLLAASMLAKTGAEVKLFERNDSVGKKLSITGKGRCNLTNNCTPAQVLENVVSNQKFLFSAINSFTPSDTMEHFESLGVPLKTERGRRVFPQSDKASDVVKALEKDALSSGVKIVLNSRVTAIRKVGEEILVTACGKEEKFDCAVVATGGASYKGTGSSGDGYDLARSLGNKICTIRAALVPIYVKEDISSLAGLSLKNVSLSLRRAQKSISLFGEMLFMHKGVSGPVVLSLSSLSEKFVDGKGEFLPGSALYIDLKPALDEEKLDKRILRDLSEGHTKALKNILPALMPKSLIAFVLAQAGISPSKRACDLTAPERERLVLAVKGLKFTPERLGSVDEGIITCGGVDVKEIDPRDFSDKKSAGVYFIGEVLDVDALTGGYNLQIAFSTAAACARGIARKYNLRAND